MLLNLRNYQARLPQTLTALAGTGFIFGLLSLLILTRIDPGKPSRIWPCCTSAFSAGAWLWMHIFTGMRCPSR